MERNIQTLAELFDTFGYKTKDTPRAIWREVFGEGLPDLSTKVTDEVMEKVCTFLSVEKKGRSGKIVATARGLLNGNTPAIYIRSTVATAVPKTRTKEDAQEVLISPTLKSPEKQEDAPAETNGADWKHVVFAGLCVCFVVAHAVLIWYDCIVLWPGKMAIGPGMIGGGMAFIFQMAALVSAFDDTRGRTSGYALFVILLVDIAAGFLHYPTFIQGSEVGETVTMVFCGFVCLLSFSSLYLLRDSKIF